MANTSAQVLTDSFSEILAYANGTGSVNFYMAHGGTNFGWTPGLFFLLCTDFGWTPGLLFLPYTGTLGFKPQTLNTAQFTCRLSLSINMNTQV